MLVPRWDVDAETEIVDAAIASCTPAATANKAGMPHAAEAVAAATLESLHAHACGPLDTSAATGFLHHWFFSLLFLRELLVFGLFRFLHGLRFLNHLIGAIESAILLGHNSLNKHRLRNRVHAELCAELEQGRLVQSQQFHPACLASD